MALSVVDLYKSILPRTNCGDCGHPTCLAFASMVVSEKYPLKNCPHIEKETLDAAVIELEEQYKTGKWLKRDMAKDALEWAKSKAASMEINDLPKRIGGHIISFEEQPAIELPYFNETIIITHDRIVKPSGETVSRWEQVFIYNHLAQGGSSLPSGKMKSFKEFPNTVSKVKSMVEQVELPIQNRYAGKNKNLVDLCIRLGGVNTTSEPNGSADVSIAFTPLPRVPVVLLFWDEDPKEAYGAEAKLLFDETVTEHLDIESIMFLSEKIKDLLCSEK